MRFCVFYGGPVRIFMIADSEMQQIQTGLHNVIGNVRDDRDWIAVPVCGDVINGAADGLGPCEQGTPFKAFAAKDDTAAVKSPVLRQVTEIDKAKEIGAVFG